MKVELEVPKEYERLAVLSDKEWKESFRAEERVESLLSLNIPSLLVVS